MQKGCEERAETGFDKLRPKGSQGAGQFLLAFPPPALKGVTSGMSC